MYDKTYIISVPVLVGYVSVIVYLYIYLLNFSNTGQTFSPKIVLFFLIVMYEYHVVELHLAEL
jgi:hypothetical protein